MAWSGILSPSDFSAFKVMEIVSLSRLELVDLDFQGTKGIMFSYYLTSRPQ